MTQLRLDDFQQIDGVWMIQVDETEETRVKTRNSIRKVPVHLLSEKLIGNITHHEANIQDQHLAALKSIVQKRKRQFKEEEKAKQVDET